MIEYETMLNQLRQLYQNSSKQATNILNSAARVCRCGQHEKSKQKNRALYKWLYSVTSCLDKYNCSTLQRAHWILNSLKEFPKCIVCGSPIDDPHQFKGMIHGYNEFCSKRCAKLHGGKVNKANRLKKNNGKYFSNEEMEKARQSFISHYGVDNNMKSEKGKKEYKDAIEKKYGKGIVNVYQVPEKKAKIKKTKLDRYGDENWNNRKKSVETFKNRTKEQKAEQQRNHRRKCLSHFGVEHQAKDPSILKKILSNRRNGCYVIDGHTFDSKPEFCFYVCCRNFGIDVVCHPLEKVIKYVDANGKSHMYCPDFYVPSIDRLVEIKGSHFFKGGDESKGLFQRFGKEDGSKKIEMKWQAMVENNVLVISTNRYVHYERWVKRHYGNKWISSFKKLTKRQMKDLRCTEVNKIKVNN